MTKLCALCRDYAREYPDNFSLCKSCVQAVVEETEPFSDVELRKKPQLVRSIALHLGVAFLGGYAVLRMISSAWAER